MKNFVRRILMFVCISVVVFTSIAAAAGGGSSATISSDKTGAWGSYFTLIYNNPNSFGDSSVTNKDTSTNVLWAAGQSSSGKEFCNCSAQPGKSGSKHVTDILPGQYRVVLDPSGPLAKGCDGSGSFSAYDLGPSTAR